MSAGAGAPAASTEVAGALVEVEDVTVAYGPVVAVSGASLVAHPGRLVAVTGHSGAGKSSLLWAVAGAVCGSSVGIMRKALDPENDPA